MVLGIRIRSTTLLALGILAGVDAKRSSKVIQGDGGLPVVDLGYGLQRATKFNVRRISEEIIHSSPPTHKTLQDRISSDIFPVN